MPFLGVSLLASLAIALASARDIPSNLATFRNTILAQKQCNNPLASGFRSTDEGSASIDYCGDAPSIIYLQGHNGALTNMDIDCDGILDGPASDGRCDSSDDTQAITSFQHIVQSYNTGQTDLDANIHPYVVFGNEGTRPGWKTFDPQAHGVEPLSVMAVVCGNKLIYGVWGDENGDDGAYPVVGETSLALATACFGKSMNGDNGHDPEDVLYIAFPGKDAVPGASGAKWNAKSYDEFEASITGLGDRLVRERVGAGGGGTCSWPGHCQGASCKDENDCSDELVCKSGKCAPL